MSLREDVIDNVTGYLQDPDNEMIGVLADRAISAYTEYRNYPGHWTDEKILAASVDKPDMVLKDCGEIIKAFKNNL